MKPSPNETISLPLEALLGAPGFPGAGLAGANLLGFIPLGADGAFFLLDDIGAPGLGGAGFFRGPALGCNTRHE